MQDQSSNLVCKPKQTVCQYSRAIDSVLVTLNLVDSPLEESFDKFTRLVTRFVKVPIALVSFVDEANDRQYFKSQIGLMGEWAKTRKTPLSHSFCQYVKRDNRPLIIENAPQDSRVCDNLAIPDLGVRAYLGVPIHDTQDNPLGALCAIDVQPREWTQSDIDGMIDLASCVTDQIAVRSNLHHKLVTF
ncbi:MAG: GAF domain-containing protein [Candidatus Saccharibacteria bacterium]|nr:GAF domain-containing protein [Pseudorhodobacter sp.]